MKNKKYNIDISVPFDLYSIIEIFRDEALSNPQEFGKMMVEFGHDGDWTLEIEYLKHLKKDIGEDYGRAAAKKCQELIDIMTAGDENC